MITLTNDILAKFNANPLYSKDGQGKKAEVIAVFHMPFTEACWLIVTHIPWVHPFSKNQLQRT